jgi:hypothetical protein
MNVFLRHGQFCRLGAAGWHRVRGVLAQSIDAAPDVRGNSLPVRGTAGRRGRRRLLAGLSWAGVAVAVCAAVIMVRWKPVAEIAGHSITYAFTPGSSVVRPFAFLAAYAIPTVLPFFFSSASLARTTGAALVVSLVASVAIKWNALTSVWCFFAAILSGLVFAAILLEGRLHAGSRPRPVFGRPGADAL